MLRIGLTGGIAAGKSTVSRRLAELGAVVIDHDVLAHAVVAPGTPGANAVAHRFGSHILTADGSIDRQALAEHVFADPAARADLEAIIHPLVRERALELQDEAARVNPDAIVVHDIPLLVETGQGGEFDLMIVVHAPKTLRIERLVGERGLSRKQAEARVEAQATDEERLAAADIVLKGSGPPSRLLEQVDEMWPELLRPGKGALGHVLLG